MLRFLVLELCDLLEAVGEAGLVLVVLVELVADGRAGLDVLEPLRLQVVVLVALVVEPRIQL